MVWDNTMYNDHQSGVHVFSEVEETDPDTVHVYFTCDHGLWTDIIIFNVCASATQTREQCYLVRSRLLGEVDACRFGYPPLNMLEVDGRAVVNSVFYNAERNLLDGTPYFRVLEHVKL